MRSERVVAKINPKYLSPKPKHDYDLRVSEDGEILWTRSLGHIGYKRPDDAHYGFMKDGQVVETRSGMTAAQAEIWLKKKFGGKHGKKKRA